MELYCFWGKGGIFDQNGKRLIANDSEVRIYDLTKFIVSEVKSEKMEVKWLNLFVFKYFFFDKMRKSFLSKLKAFSYIMGCVNYSWYPSNLGGTIQMPPRGPGALRRFFIQNQKK